RLSGHTGDNAAFLVHIRRDQPHGRSNLCHRGSKDKLLNSMNPAAEAILDDRPADLAVASPMPILFPHIRRRSGIRRLLSTHSSAVIGLIILTIMALIALLANHLWTVDPTRLSPAFRNRDPSLSYWFGTDMLGRDLYSRV